MELSSSKIKKFLILFGPALKSFPQKDFLYFLLKKLSLKKFLIFSQKWKFLAQRFPKKKKKRFRLFWEMELFGPKTKTFLYFRKKTFSYISGNGTF